MKSSEKSSLLNIYSFFSLIILSAIWGSSFIFIKISVETIPPSILTFYRLFIASLFLVIFCIIKKKTNFFSSNLFDLFVIAIFGNVLPFNLISWTEIYVDSFVASTLIGTMPLFTFLIAFFFKKNGSFNFITLVGIIIGFSGMIVFISPDKNVIENILNTSFSFLILLSAIFYAISANWVKKTGTQSAIEVATGSTILATIISLPVSILLLKFSNNEFHSMIESISIKSFISASILGAVCTGLAVSIFFSIIKIHSAVFASQSNYLIPCFGFFWSYLFLNEELTTNLFLGLILIVLGGFLVNKKMSF